MLFVLGIGTTVALTSAVVSVICDQFVSLRFWMVALVTSVCGFGLGLMYVTPVSCNCSFDNFMLTIYFAGRTMDAESGGLLWRNIANIRIGLV